MAGITTPTAPKPKKPLDRMRDKLRLKNYSYRTEKSYVGWARRYILFHDKRHPKYITFRRASQWGDFRQQRFSSRFQGRLRPAKLSVTARRVVDSGSAVSTPLTLSNDQEKGILTNVSHPGVVSTTSNPFWHGC